MAKAKKVVEDLGEVVEEKASGIASLESVMRSLQKDFGKEIYINASAWTDLPRVKSSSPRMGYTMGNGGLAKGRIYEFYGPESSGKTSLACVAGADTQREGKAVIFIDVEHAFEPKFAKIYGLNTEDPKKFLWFQPNSGEEAFEIASRFVDVPGVGLIILDSVAQLVTQAELDGEMTDQQMGILARLMGKGIRKINMRLKKNGVAMIFINQIRMKLGCVSPETMVEWYKV